jgi:hypothetical protein
MMFPTPASGAQPSSSDAASSALRRNVTSETSFLSSAAVAGLRRGGLAETPWARVAAPFSSSSSSLSSKVRFSM